MKAKHVGLGRELVFIFTTMQRFHLFLLTHAKSLSHTAGVDIVDIDLQDSQDMAYWRYLT